MLNLDNKKFVAVENTANGEVSSQTEFHYHQQGKMIWAEYGGGEILKGFLIGKWVDDTQIEFTYQHLNQSLENRLGRCCTRFSLEERISSVHQLLKRSHVAVCFLLHLCAVSFPASVIHAHSRKSAHFGAADSR